MNRQMFLSIMLAFMSLAAKSQQFSFGTATNPDGHTVTVDGYGLMFDGRHQIPVMGEIHYARVPEADWRREIRKMRAGGITVVATYVFWVHHEYDEGRWDWSGNRNLHRFLEICKEEQMPVVLRVGPFCHGEVYQGGFPNWLVEKAAADPKQFRLRSEAPGFMAATRRLYSNIFAQCNDMLWKNGGTVIGMQLENECRGPWSYYMALKRMALEIGFDLPFYTRTGWPKLNGKEAFGEMLPLYGDYADGFWDRTLDDMPGDYRKAFVMKDTRLSSVIATEALGTDQDTRMEQSDLQYPYLTCELGGGMMPSYHRRINISGREILPLAICKLGSGSNLPGYYMYHGGTNPYNPAHSMAETQRTTVTNYNDMPLITYDFQSPLGEMGQMNETAFHTSRWLHQFLADWGEELSTLAPVMARDANGKEGTKTDGKVKEGTPQDGATQSRRGPFLFSNTYVRMLNEQGSANVTPHGMEWEGLTISSDDVQPFAKTDGALYFITALPLENTSNMSKLSNSSKPRNITASITINKKAYRLKADKPMHINGKTITLLSPAKAKAAFKIDGAMHYAQHGGILYRGDSGIVEETWQPTDEVKVECLQTKQHGGLRTVALGSQKVAAMPEEADFDKAAAWTLQFTAEEHPAIKNDVLMTLDAHPTALDKPDDYFVEIQYRGDVARVYADGQLVEDNFWNGKPMLVRLSDLAGKRVELRILPLGKDYPIYLQREQRAELDKAENGILISLDSIKILKRTTTASPRT